MTRTALIIGGNGQIGRATAAALLAAGWRVISAQRAASPNMAQGITSIALDRDAPDALARAVAGGVDVVIDTIAYDDVHARQLLEIESDVGAFVVISSASVYADYRGRTLDEAQSGGFPHLPEPIGEDQPTVLPGPKTYSTRKVALEQTLLQTARRPVTILRPCAIHGDGSRQPREWFFVRRVLDDRREIPLAFNGQSRFHTSATVNIAELIRFVLDAPATLVLNAADPESLTALQIGEAVAAVYNHTWRFIPIEGPPVNGVGAHPWCVRHPFIVDMARAMTLGYRPVAQYQDVVGAACHSAQTMSAAGMAMPAYIEAMFDYAAEDAFLRNRK
jgi:nucleoside-diphosphate-sugar epimerase